MVRVKYSPGSFYFDGKIQTQWLKRNLYRTRSNLVKVGTAKQSGDIKTEKKCSRIVRSVSSLFRSHRFSRRRMQLRTWKYAFSHQVHRLGQFVAIKGWWKPRGLFKKKVSEEVKGSGSGGSHSGSRNCSFSFYFSHSISPYRECHGRYGNNGPRWWPPWDFRTENRWTAKCYERNKKKILFCTFRNIPVKEGRKFFRAPPE